jgi:hypothetical protein
MPSAAPPSSPLAAKLKAMQQANIIAAKAKRKHPEPVVLEEQFPAIAGSQVQQEQQQEQQNKAPRHSGRDSPGGSASSAAAAAPGEGPVTSTKVGSRVRGSKKK